MEIQMARKTAAYKMHLDIMAAGEVAAEAFTTFCRLLKTMRDDKLYTELEYSSFEVYCENAVGIKQSQVYNYIKALEDFGEEKFQSIGKLGIRKLQLIGTVAKEQREEFMADNNLDEMTTRQVEAAVKEYKEKLADAEDKFNLKVVDNVRLQDQLKNSREKCEQESRLADEHWRKQKEAEKLVEEQKGYISKLNATIQQLKDEKDKTDPNEDYIKQLEESIDSQNEKINTLQQQLNSPMEATVSEVIKEVEVEKVPDDYYFYKSSYNELLQNNKNLLNQNQAMKNDFQEDKLLTEDLISSEDFRTTVSMFISKVSKYTYLAEAFKIIDKNSKNEFSKQIEKVEIVLQDLKSAVAGEISNKTILIGAYRD